MRTLQRALFPKLEECWNTPLTGKDKQFVPILELVQIEMFVPRSSDTQRLGRKLHKRESVARSFVAKSVYGYPFTSALIEALKTTPSLRKICGFEKVSVKKLSKQKPVPKIVGVESRENSRDRTKQNA